MRLKQLNLGLTGLLFTLWCAVSWGYDVAVHLNNAAPVGLYAKGIVNYEQDGQVFNQYPLPDKPMLIEPWRRAGSVTLDYQRFLAYYEIESLNLYDAQGQWVQSCLDTPVRAEQSKTFVFDVLFSPKSSTWQCQQR